MATLGAHVAAFGVQEAPFGVHVAPFWVPCGHFGIPFGSLWAPLKHPWGSQWLPLGVHLDDLGVPLAKKMQISKKVEKSELEDPPQGTPKSFKNRCKNQGVRKGGPEGSKQEAGTPTKCGFAMPAQSK